MATNDDKRERRRFWREFGLRVLDIVGRLIGSGPAKRGHRNASAHVAGAATPGARAAQLRPSAGAALRGVAAVGGMIGVAASGLVWLGVAALVLLGCPSEPPPHPIHVDQSDVAPHCKDYCTRAVDTGLPSGVECECPPASVPTS